MLKLGDYNTLKVIKEVDFGLYLDGGEGVEILLPKRYVPEGTKIGSELEVFLYKDSEDRKVATTQKPKAKVGECAFLTIKDVNKTGAFLDWGLEKDLMLPYSEYDKVMKVGEKIIVKVLLDRLTDRIFASTKVVKHSEKDLSELKVDQEVDLLIFKHTDLGFNCIIDNKYIGMLYKNDLTKPYYVGDSLKGFIQKIRIDGKIDLKVRKKGYQEVLSSKDIIMEKLIENEGYLALTDDSSPDKIREVLGMSKKTFKQAIGGLYKEKKIELMTRGIKLLKK